MGIAPGSPWKTSPRDRARGISFMYEASSNLLLPSIDSRGGIGGRVGHPDRTCACAGQHRYDILQFRQSDRFPTGIVFEVNDSFLAPEVAEYLPITVNPVCWGFRSAWTKESPRDLMAIGLAPNLQRGQNRRKHLRLTASCPSISTGPPFSSRKLRRLETDNEEPLFTRGKLPQYNAGIDADYGDAPV